jgi:hypothetical protein
LQTVQWGGGSYYGNGYGDDYGYYCPPYYGSYSSGNYGGYGNYGNYGGYGNGGYGYAPSYRRYGYAPNYRRYGYAPRVYGRYGRGY